MFYGSALQWNQTHVVTPECPGRPDSRFADNTAAGSQLLIVDGPGTGQYRRVVAADMPATGQCSFELDKPFVGLDDIPISNISIVVAAFTGRNIFDRNTFEDGGPFQFCASALSLNVLPEHLQAAMASIPMYWHRMSGPSPLEECDVVMVWQTTLGCTILPLE